MIAGLAWGATTVVVRCSRLSEAPATLTLFYQLAVGFAGLLLIALLSGQIGAVTLTPLAMGSVLVPPEMHGVGDEEWSALLTRVVAAFAPADPAPADPAPARPAPGEPAGSEAETGGTR